MEILFDIGYWKWLLLSKFNQGDTSPYGECSRYGATYLYNVSAAVESRKEGVGTLEPQAGVHVAVEKEEEFVEPIAAASAVENHLNNENISSMKVQSSTHR